MLRRRQLPPTLCRCQRGRQAVILTASARHPQALPCQPVTCQHSQLVHHPSGVETVGLRLEPQFELLRNVAMWDGLAAGWDAALWRTRWSCCHTSLKLSRLA